MAFPKLPRLPLNVPLIDAKGCVTPLFQRWWASVCDRLEAQEALQDATIADLASAVAAIVAAQAAADAAQAAADAAAATASTATASAATANAAAATADAAAVTANAAAAAASTAASTANTAATTAQTTANTIQSLNDLQASQVSPSITITGHDAGANVTVSIGAHNRIYGNGTSVSVNSGTVTGLGYSSKQYLYYDDAARAGGAVTYHATSTPVTAQPTASTPDRHFVGSILTPAALAADTSGNPNIPIPPPDFNIPQW